MENLDEFVNRFSKSVGSYYHQCDSGIFSLKKVNTDIRGAQRVFAWVEERQTKGLFKVGTYYHLAEEAGVIDLADGEKSNMNWGIPGVFYNVKKSSTREDFQKAVKALRAIFLLK